MPTISFKRRHFQHDRILQSLRWSLAYALSYRDIDEMMAMSRKGQLKRSVGNEKTPAELFHALAA